MNLLALLCKDCMKNSSSGGGESRFNELEGRKVVRQEFSGMSCEASLHGDMKNGVFVSVNFLPSYPPQCSNWTNPVYLIINMSLEAMGNSSSFRQSHG